MNWDPVTGQSRCIGRINLADATSMGYIMAAYNDHYIHGQWVMVRPQPAGKAKGKGKGKDKAALMALMGKGKGKDKAAAAGKASGYGGQFACTQASPGSLRFT